MTTEEKYKMLGYKRYLKRQNKIDAMRIWLWAGVVAERDKRRIFVKFREMCRGESTQENSHFCVPSMNYSCSLY